MTRFRKVMTASGGRLGLLLGILMSLCCTFASSTDEVTSLTSENFASFVSQAADKPVIVEFFAPWCGHCKAFAPQYSKAAKDMSSRAYFAKMDATMYRDIATAHGVKGFPTVVWFKGNAENFRIYRGSQTVQGIEELVDAITSDPVLQLQSAAELSEFQSKHVVSQILFLSKDCDKKKAQHALTAFTVACGGLQDVTNCAVISTETRDEIPNSLSIAAARFEKLEVTPIVLPLDGTIPLATTEVNTLTQTVKRWMDQFHLPLVSEVTSANFGAVTHAGRISVLVVCADAEMADSLKHTFIDAVHPVTADRTLGKALPKFNFGTFVIVDERAQKYMEKYGITVENAPQILALEYDRDRYYQDTSYKVTKDGITQFVIDVTNGKVQEQGLSLSATLDLKWEAAVRIVPLLSYLNFLPRFTLVMSVVLVVLALVFWSILRDTGRRKDD